jgi:hypothetical protein
VSAIDRVRYYDGEFLRAFDFNDEQSYHLEMRRRLNRHLHLHGIVYGLQLQKDEDAAGVSILPGLAIDAFGREIYVFSPYTLGESDITANRISDARPYDVWLRYRKNATTPPAAGYSSCNQTNQYTRWTESFRVVLLPGPSKPFTDPEFADDDTDDPDQDQVGVLLGTVGVDPNSLSSTFYGPMVANRDFLGIIAQRIQTPLAYDATESFNFRNKQEPHQPAASLEIEPNIFARQNLILGPDFDLTMTPAGNPIKPPDDPFTSSPSGSAKLAGDLVVQGNIYSYVQDAMGKPQWMGLRSYVKQLVQQGLPDIASGNQPVIDPTTGTFAAGVFMGTSQVQVTMNRLKSFSSQQVIVSFTQIETASQTDLSTLFTGGAQVQIRLNGPPQFQFTPGTTTGWVNVSWAAQPAIMIPAKKCAIQNFTVTCWVILFP